MLADKMTIEEKARNIIDFARSVNENNIDKVVKALLNLIKEQTNENFIKEGQGQKITEFRQR